MIYKVHNESLRQCSTSVDYSFFEMESDEQIGFIRLQVLHSPGTLETVFKLRMLTHQVIIYSQNPQEFVETVRYVRSLGMMRSVYETE